MKRKCFFSTKKRFLALYCIVLFVIVGLYVAYRFYVRDLREFYGGLFRNELNALPHVFVCFVPFWGWLAVIGISVVQEIIFAHAVRRVPSEQKISVGARCSIVLITILKYLLLVVFFSVEFMSVVFNGYYCFLYQPATAACAIFLTVLFVLQFVRFIMEMSVFFNEFFS